jgi:hypothetical protein
MMMILADDKKNEVDIRGTQARKKDRPHFFFFFFVLHADAVIMMYKKC